MRVLAILNVLGQDEKSVLALSWTDLDYGVHDRLSKENIRIVLEAVLKELEQLTSLVGKAVV